ncbi:MAG: flagellar export chaperone FliS [Lachnospiraceae bacterium]|jgi:flagellar protein FliS|nr:flagellar export chaperone FliS [Lachnospiraceae bacterium]SDA44618.1 flagellar protein FliS [Lachnospiraceae bacterium G11]
MTYNNAYAQYNNSKVLTASPAELTLMLYDGAIKFCNIAIMAVGQNDITKTHTNIVKAEKIVDYLRSTLDMRYEVSKDFERVYVYLQRRLVEANMQKDIVIIEEVRTHLQSMRDTWKEVMAINKDKNYTPQPMEANA